MIPGDPTENAVARNGNVSVSNGRPTRTFNFKLTPACMALRVCKFEGGRRIVICLDAKELRWPTYFSGGPEISLQSGGLVKAQPVAKAPSLSEGTLVKQDPPFGFSDGQSSWVHGKSSKGGSGVDFSSPMTALVPVNPDVVARTSVASKPGLSGMVVTYRRKRDETQTPTARDLRVGMTVWSPRAAAEAPMVPMVVLEAPNPISMASHPDRVVERQFGDESRNMLDSNSPRQIE